jgi:nucleoside-diphosphate-sugar epimerase
MKVMITGAAGFIGGVLARYAVEQGADVLGIGVNAPESFPAPAHFEICDVRHTSQVSKLIALFRPERVFHLAARSHPTVSLEKPIETVEVNVGGTVNVFEGLRAAGLDPAVVVACSSAEYGPVAAENLPVREEHPLRPLHHYGVSKTAQDLLAYQYFANYGQRAIRIRIFNTTGPGKVGDVCSDLTRRAVEIEAGLAPPRLRVGNLGSRRAILDVRDLVNGLWLACEKAEAGEVYNISANSIYSVEDLIGHIRQRITVPFEVEQEASLLRTQDEPVIAGDTTKFRAISGWSQRIDLSNTIDAMIAWWRKRVVRAVMVA